MRTLCHRLVRLAGITLFTPPFVADALDVEGLVARNPKPPASHILEVTHQNGRWLLGAENGLISHGIDGLNWATVAVSYPKGIESLIHWNGVYYAGSADSRRLMKSTDLVNWTETSPENFPFNSRQFLADGDTLYAVGYTPSLAKTTDGETWEEVSLPVAGRFEGMARDGDRLILVGTTFDSEDADEDGDTLEGIILVSDDGETWTTQLTNVPITNSGLEDDFLFVDHVNGTFVAGGKQGLLASSADGLSWDVHATPFESWMYGAVFHDGTWYFPGRNGRLHNTDDFTTWNPDVQSGSTQTLQDISSDGSRIVAAGRDGLVVVSDDGADWPLVNTGTQESLLEIEFGADVFVAADSSGGIWRSVDSESWTQVFTDEGGDLLEGLEWDGSQFAGVTAGGTLLTSPDGETWTPSNGHDFSGRVERVRRINGMWWVVGNGGMIASSPNLATWNEINEGEARFLDIAVGNGAYVISGIAADNSEGVIYSSTDGIVWHERDTGLEADNGTRLNTVNYANDKFVVLGQGSELLTSSDGISWTSGAVGQPPLNCSKLGVIDGAFVAPDLNGIVGVSIDGLNWDRLQSRTGRALYDIVVAADRTVAVGSAGTVMSSDPVVASGFAAWVESRFTEPQQLDPLSSGPGADPDVDDVPNALEYFSNTPPLLVDASPGYRAVVVSAGGIDYPGIEIRRANDLVDAVIALRSTPALPGWDALSSGEIVEVSITPIDTETDLVIYRTTTPFTTTPTVFLQVGVQFTD